MIHSSGCTPIGGRASELLERAESCRNWFDPEPEPPETIGGSIGGARTADDEPCHACFGGGPGGNWRPAVGEAALPAAEADPAVEAAVLAATEEGRVAEAADKTYPRLWERPSVASSRPPCHHSPPLQVGPPYPAVRAAASAAHPA